MDEQRRCGWGLCVGERVLLRNWNHRRLHIWDIRCLILIFLFAFWGLFVGDCLSNHEGGFWDPDSFGVFSLFYATLEGLLDIVFIMYAFVDCRKVCDEYEVLLGRTGRLPASV